MAQRSICTVAVAFLVACGPAVDPGTPPIADHSDRQAVIAAYRPALQLKADLAHGKQIFFDTCAKCHHPRRDGIQVGPELAQVEHRAPEELLESLLNPNARIDPKFQHYIVRTTDGDVDDGLLAAETPDAVTLRDNEGDRVIPRSRIAALRVSQVSLMPEDIERGLSRQAIADLIAYLRSLRR